MNIKKPNINLHNIKNDVFSGIIVALVSIPISMGYAQIAGLPAVYGLYGSLLPILVYGFFASSPQFVVGVDAMPAAMIGSTLASLGITNYSPEAMAIVPAITILVAVWLFFFRIIKAGRALKYISNAVLGGFITGVGLTIITMQIPKLWGGNPGTGEILQLIPHIFSEFKNFNILSFALGLGTVIIIQISKKFFPKFPMTVVMLAAGFLIGLNFDINKYGVKLLPAVESGLPKLSLVNMTVLEANFLDYATLSLTIALVIMAQTLLAASSYATKYDYKLDNNKELIAYCMMNIAGAVSGSCPINGSVSRSGIADQFGCKSQIMSVAASVTMLLVLLFCTRFFIYLPVPVLTGIVLSALIGILDIKQAKKLWKINRQEFYIFIFACLGVLFLGTIYGVVIGVILSFMVVVKDAVVPPRSFLGRIPGQHGYYNLARNKNAIAIQNTIIYRFGGNLFFANIQTFEEDIEKAIKPDTKYIIIDASGIGDIDLTAAEKLKQLSKNLEQRNILFFLTEHQGHINDLLRQYGAEELIENGKVRRTIAFALKSCGLKKPFPLEGNSSEDLIEFSTDDRYAEFEWAFGDEAKDKMQKMANEMVAEFTAIIASISVEQIDSINLEEIEEKISWGKIGLFDEENLLQTFVLKVEELYKEGKITKEQIKALEKLIDNRKKVIEEKVSLINPRALELLHNRIGIVDSNIQNHKKEKLANLKKIGSKLHIKIKKRND